MKELQEILKRIAQFKENERAILATVVDVVGSGYRRAGARMLIDENGYSIGTVSGGCLEADVLERAKKVLKTDEAIVITYDTMKDENSVFGLSMGCRGIVRILLEAVTKKSSIFNQLALVLENRKEIVIATLISAKYQTKVGGRLFYNRSQRFTQQNLPETLENFFELKFDCETKHDGRIFPPTRTYKTDTGEMEFFIERIKPPLSLLLFGAGFDALPVVRFAKELGWRVTVIDHRAAFANAERLPEADEIIVAQPEDLPEELFKDENSVAVVMTRNYERDREILFRLLNSSCQYIGALGPKKRTENLLEDLRAKRVKIDAMNLNRIYAPIGLDIGSETPEEIALAVVAEIKTSLENRRGGFLRDKNK